MEEFLRRPLCRKKQKRPVRAHSKTFNFSFLFLCNRNDNAMSWLKYIDKYYCCGATVGSEQQHNQDLKEIYKGRRILEFITFYHNALHLTTFFYQNSLHLTRVHCTNFYQTAMRQGQVKCKHDEERASFASQIQSFLCSKFSTAWLEVFRASGKVRGCDPTLSTKNRTISHYSLFPAPCRTFRVYLLKKPISYKISFENRNKCDERCVYKMI